MSDVEEKLITWLRNKNYEQNLNIEELNAKCDLLERKLELCKEQRNNAYLDYDDFEEWTKELDKDLEELK